MPPFKFQAIKQKKCSACSTPVNVCTDNWANFSVTFQLKHDEENAVSFKNNQPPKLNCQPRTQAPPNAQGGAWV